jgi:hypothetical protein
MRSSALAGRRVRPPGARALTKMLRWGLRPGIWAGWPAFDEAIAFSQERGQGPRADQGRSHTLRVCLNELPGRRFNQSALSVSTHSFARGWAHNVISAPLA